MQVKHFFILFFFSFFSLNLSSVCLAADNNLNNSFDSVTKTAISSGYLTGPHGDIVMLIGSIIQTVLSLVGVFFLVLTLYAGWLWMSAQGDAKKVDTSQTILKNAIIGLVIVLFSYAISSFIISRFTMNTLRTSIDYSLS